MFLLRISLSDGQKLFFRQVCAWRAVVFVYTAGKFISILISACPRESDACYSCLIKDDVKRILASAR